ncbi:MAG: hypothetical protein H5U21_00045 [Porphyrobacter sp.]|nr:hypothetical protein [Porphyrobacter sp.]
MLRRLLPSAALRPLRRLAACRSGNAAILMGLGMPMLIGGAGLGVDTAQWYLWKRELQFAVDQAAIAGAYAKAADEAGTGYIDRAQQEYEANVSVVAGFDTVPVVSLADYDGGTANSIRVTASATQTLPFSSFLTGAATTVAVEARAIYEPGTTYRPCLMALDPHAADAMLFNGNVTVVATCGVGALSDHESSVTKLGGSGVVDVTFVVTKGNIDDQHNHFDTEEVIVHSDDLADPYDELTPPTNATPRTLTCPASNNKYTADETVTIRAEYSYFKGKNKNSLTPYAYSDPKPTTTTNTVTTGKTFNSQPANSQSTAKPTYAPVPGSGNDGVWESETLTTTTSYANIVAPGSGPAAALPGTYTSFTISCDTILSSGVYVLDGVGATLKMAGQHRISGTGVMIVLKNGAGLQISGGSEIDLTAMSEDQLIAAGVPSADVAGMLGMLIFEDPDSPGATGNQLTGNSTQILNGVVYLPNSDLKIAGTPRGTSQCMVLASLTLQIAGTTDLTTLCPANVTPNAAIGEVRDVVRLVR